MVVSIRWWALMLLSAAEARANDGGTGFTPLAAIDDADVLVWGQGIRAQHEADGCWLPCGSSSL
jgi:hypothetical protein